MADIVVNINMWELAKLGQDMGILQQKINQALSDAVDEISERLERRIQEELAGFGLAGSGLAKEIAIIPTYDGITIRCGTEYAVFVEYGTGIKGANNPHPKPEMGWVYDKNEHGDDGWWYPTTEADPNPYKFVDKNGQLRAWTRGMGSRPFMYNTWKYGRLIASRIVKKHLRRVTL